ncbi:RNA polymerase sigma-70 factor [Zhouia spongiae]|uniref:RNA polymerase sigma-70 factor n=1 Tax=Zhouia spongiae TaxID=2202721 RepID=A0ABY3YN04_9FLAO|nr:RNA polymerase sigma-70 factor [Zhouia spongiae]UNY98934.1 RNA polymerase sigma-70 factor [Zhouia spongiae]
MKEYSLKHKLIADFKKGNVEAYKEIYLTYYQDLCIYACSYTNDHYAAEDLVQNVLLKFWENRASINIDTALKSYLYKSVHNSFIDGYRKEKNQKENLEDLRYKLLIDSIEENTDIQDSRLAILREGIGELPQRCREIFMMSKFEGMSYKQIAENLNISVNTVENQIGKAFKILRTKLKTGRYVNLFIDFFVKKLAWRKTTQKNLVTK